jgi:hypothetical protein
MTDSEMLLRRLIADGNEGPKVDFKSHVKLREPATIAKLAKHCLAVANTDSAEFEGSGFVILGAEARQLVGGLDDLGIDSFRASLLSQLNRYIEPEARLELRAYNDPEKGWFGAIVVRPSPPALQPHTIARAFEDKSLQLRVGECYVRRGESTELARKSDYDRLFEKRHAERSRGQEQLIGALDAQLWEMRAVLESVAKVSGATRRPGGKARKLLLLAAGPLGWVTLFGAELRQNFQEALFRSQQSEAKAYLKAIFTAFKAHFQEFDGFPTTFEEAKIEILPSSRYLYFGPQSHPIGGGAIPDRERFVHRASAALREHSVVPRIASDSFLIGAVADLRPDGKLDVWTIDQTGELHNPTARSFGTRYAAINQPRRP